VQTGRFSCTLLAQACSYEASRALAGSSHKRLLYETDRQVDLKAHLNTSFSVRRSGLSSSRRSRFYPFSFVLPFRGVMQKPPITSTTRRIAGVFSPNSTAAKASISWRAWSSMGSAGPGGQRDHCLEYPLPRTRPRHCSPQNNRCWRGSSPLCGGCWPLSAHSSSSASPSASAHWRT